MRPSVAADGAAAAHYAARVGALARRENLPPFDAGRTGEDCASSACGWPATRSRVLAMLEPIDDLARESAYFARSEGAQRVSAAHVERALGERMLRLNFIEEEIRTADRGRHAHRAYSRLERRTDQRPRGARRRRLQLRTPVARDGYRRARAGGPYQHRARGADVGIDARQGNHDPERISARAIRPDSIRSR